MIVVDVVIGRKASLLHCGHGTVFFSQLLYFFAGGKLKKGCRIVVGH